MVKLTRLNGQGFILNSDLIETLEATPDTVVTLINGKKIIVLESVGEVVDGVAGFRRMIHPDFTGSRLGCPPELT